MIRISVFYDGNPVKEFKQDKSDKEITIGRAAGCSVQLDEPSISRLHALIHFQNGSWILERKANFGAVLLNGQEVENAPLEGGEEITIGKFALRLDIESSEEKSFPSMAHNDEEDGRTKFVSTGVNALFRFEPGAANLSEFLMQKDLAVFGRGSNCDVVLTEKKASRKHCEIRRQGLSFFLKDLNSSNGTLVNGGPITEAELVPGDIIQVGESKFEFSIENKEYFSQQEQFLPVPSHLDSSDSQLSPVGQFQMPQNDLGQGEGFQSSHIPGIDSPSSEEEPQSLVGKLKKRYLAMNLRQRLIAIGVAFIFTTSLLTMLLGDPDEPKKKAPSRAKAVNGQTIRRIEDLTPEKRKFVIENYKNLLEVFSKRDYAKMLEYTGKILNYVDDYKDTKSYESQAKKGLEEMEEARRSRELKEKQEKIRAEVLALEEKGKSIFERAMQNSSARPELDAVIQEIYSRDPNNRLAVEWKAKLKEKDEEDKLKLEAARQKEELRIKAEEVFAQVEKIFKEDKYIQALAESEKIDSVGYNEKDFADRVEALRTQIREKLNSVLGPKLREAAAQRSEGGDLVKAKDLYLEVLKIDATNKEASTGLESIRETLHNRAKKFYAEAILAESVSDLVDAKDKYEKCFHSAPEEDIYKRRCKKKLSRFDGFSVN